jgi:hypothetical protein
MGPAGTPSQNLNIDTAIGESDGGELAVVAG